MRQRSRPSGVRSVRIGRRAEATESRQHANNSAFALKGRPSQRVGARKPGCQHANNRIDGPELVFFHVVA